MSLPPGFTRPPVWEQATRKGLVRVGEREFKGSRFFDLRLWSRDGTIPWGGCTVPLDKVEALARALTAYAATLPAGGADRAE